MTDFFRELFAYNESCNQQLADLFLQHREQVSEQSAFLFNHILNAHHIWISRITQAPLLYGIDTIHGLGSIKSTDKDNHAATQSVIDTIHLNSLISYKNLKGDPFQNTVQDILFHIINHSTYHRGQIATECRKHGIKPLLTDYIFYARDKKI